ASRGGPWGRLQRTSYFLAVTTFGRAEDAQAAIARVRAVHERVTGTAPDGRPYAASDPHLLTWVHITEADSFLRAHTRLGAQPLDQAGRDGYVADMARIGAALGVPDPPRTEAGLAARITAYRAELAGTAQAREAARFLLLTPPLPASAPAPPPRPRPSGRAPGRPTPCWQPQRCRCCPGGPAGRCACPACPRPRSPSSAPQATPWFTSSAGPSPRPGQPRPASPAQDQANDHHRGGHCPRAC